MKKLLLAFGMMALAAGAFAQVFDFTIVNKTGHTIDAIYVSPADDDQWDDDVLGVDVLANGSTVEIEFDSDYEDLLLAFDIDTYDLRCEYEDGSTDEWYGLKLEDIAMLTLTLDRSGNGTASWN